ncbi:MAG: hypothetical protein QY322_03715 [bacterium]|nr:MAG: hypothetical protein QY322_03715 [bacterium]
MKSLKKSSIAPLVIILVSIISVFIVSRLITFSIMEWKILPPFLFAVVGEFRLHHLVYGNILITITSFLAIGLGIRKHKNWFALFYGIGLGLVLDEFLLWIGDVEQLTSNVLWIPYSGTIIAVVSIIIATIIMFRLYQIKPIHHRHSFKLVKK